MKLTKVLVKLACRKYKGRDKQWAKMIKAGVALDKRFNRVETLKGTLRKIAKTNPDLVKFATLPQYFPGTV